MDEIESLMSGVTTKDPTESIAAGDTFIISPETDPNFIDQITVVPFQSEADEPTFVHIKE